VSDLVGRLAVQGWDKHPVVVHQSKLAVGNQHVSVLEITVGNTGFD